MYVCSCTYIWIQDMLISIKLDMLKISLPDQTNVPYIRLIVYMLLFKNDLFKNTPLTVF